ncbi:cation/H(+) antiporter 28-like [Chenopodium quinoa]|uniref:cation/H(+) antiporter 28-like n=1 Tax=Chenopodium quinoa TaxID=63459 RepID=UPI000B78F972|nr:cation/H(+) antiporter 28-like [Chenopodium quinoa]
MEDDTTDCNNAISNVASYVICFISLLGLCHGLHILVKPFSQPRIISETIVGFSLANWTLVKSSLLHIDDNKLKNMKFLTDFGMTIYMFALGLEMNPLVFFRIPKREVIFAYTVMIFTFIMTSGSAPFLHYGTNSNLKFYLAFSIMLSSTGSPLLTRVLTDLKIGKSNIGKFAISAAVYSELVTIFIICVGYVIFQAERGFRVRVREPDQHKYLKGHGVIPLGATLLVQIIITLIVGPRILHWVNNTNPHGKTFKGSHLVLSVAFVVCIGCISPLMGFTPVLSAFVTGAFLPREGRISQFFISKSNYFLTFVFYPFFFVWVGLEAQIGRFEFQTLGSWARLFGFFVVETVAKIIGALLSGLIFDIQWPESITLALLLNVKGHLHIYLTIIAMKYNGLMQNRIISYSTGIGMIFAMLLKIIYIPIVAKYIVRRARKRFPNQPLALQWHDPTKELRILLGFHGVENVPCAINLMEISKETGDPGIVVYATDMIELTDHIAATLVPGGVDAIEVTDEVTIQNREQITTTLQEYLEKNGDGITLRRAMALATFNNMHQEICNLAEDSIISLIILPFHNGLPNDGKTNDSHVGFRYVNRKVLRNAPCSIAILVDRGFGATSQISKSRRSTLNTIVIFIGGKDDREALAYAGRTAYHPGVKLTVMRLLVDIDAESNNTRRTNQLLEEMELDDECFANFYERHIAGGKVSYLEKHLINSAQAYTILRSLDGQYELFIVGRAGRVNSMLTMGMNDWEQCPELGPLGDILSCPNFSITASVLIIQQHNPKVEPGGCDNELSFL